MNVSPAETILVLAPPGKDGVLSAEDGDTLGLRAESCSSLGDLSRRLIHDGNGTGAVLLGDEAAGSPAELAELTDWLRNQEPWSDLPMVLLTTAESANSTATQDLLAALEPFGVVTVLERPARRATMTTALQVAIRARRRQYQVRDLLARQHEYAAALELAKAEAETANRAKDQFLAVLSHELRTPLNAILGWTQLMQVDPDDRDTRLTALEVIERNTKAQVQLIEDLLDVSRITNGKLKLDVRPVDPQDVVHAVLDTVRPAADARGVTLNRPPSALKCQVQADPDRLQQIVWNLLTNAIKFTPRGGRVDIRAEQTEACFELTVADTGQGIAPDFLPAIFDRFTQQDTTSTRNYKGLGLGLSICRHLAEQHGGMIFVQSPGLGLGSTFTLRLPLWTLPSAVGAEDCSLPPTPTPTPEGELNGIRVLVVDDDPDARTLLKQLLSRRGAVVLLASNAAEAFHSVERMAPDVMLCDIEMPGENGYSLIQRVRSLGTAAGGALPAAALTAYARAEDRQRALATGFQHHIAKPLDPGAIVALVAGMACRPAAAAG